jgi:DNA polymerase-3 subunit delta
MPSAATITSPVLLVCGEDEFGVKQRAREIFQKWSDEIGGMDHEIIDAAASHAGEALKSLAKLRAALQTLPFFGSGKVVWLRNCNFLGEERAAAAQSVTENLAELSKELKAFVWQNVRLLISAGKVDKRKSFYKALEKIGSVETFAGWTDDGEWAEQAQAWALRALRGLNNEISDEALALLVASIGPNVRMLDSEIEKLSVYVAPRARIEVEDVTAIVTRNKQARAFALGDALGDRHLARVLACLDRELWEIRRDTKRNEIGLLYGLISKVRVLIFIRELLARRWLQPKSDFNSFKAQLACVPADALPDDKKLNPLAMHPYVLFQAMPQANNYSQGELIAAMDLLLECNQKLISRNLDASLVLQQTLIQIVSRPAEATPGQPRLKPVCSAP